MSFTRYLFAEVTRGYLLEENEELYTEKQRRFHTFMKTPRELEKVSHVCARAKYKLFWSLEKHARAFACS